MWRFTWFDILSILILIRQRERKKAIVSSIKCSIQRGLSFSNEAIIFYSGRPSCFRDLLNVSPDRVYFYPCGNTFNIYPFAARAPTHTGQKSIQSAFAPEMQQVVGRPCSSAFLSTGSSIFRRVWHFLRRLEIEGAQPSPRCVLSPRRVASAYDGYEMPTYVHIRARQGELANCGSGFSRSDPENARRTHEKRAFLPSDSVLFDRCVFRLFREIIEETPLIIVPAGA